MSDFLTTPWKMLLARGVIAMLFGVFAMALPVATIVALVTLWGAWALLDGISLIGQATGGRSTLDKVLLGLMGVVALLAALYAFLRPGATAVTLTWVLGIWLIVRGVTGLVAGVVGEAGSSRLALLGGAVVDGLLGLLFVLNPGRSALSLAFVLGVVAFAWGVMFVAAALVTRSRDHGHGTTPAAAAT